MKTTGLLHLCAWVAGGLSSWGAPCVLGELLNLYLYGTIGTSVERMCIMLVGNTDLTVEDLWLNVIFSRSYLASSEYILGLT